MLELMDLKDRLIAWMFDRALPLWRDTGTDTASGAFHDAVDATGRPVVGPRRARVQARQIQVFCWAGSQGWTGAWAEAANDGLDYFLAKHRRLDGLFRTLTGTDGAALDNTAPLYDQAFSLFALAAIVRSIENRHTEAVSVAAE